jgi:hypothetical protein
MRAWIIATALLIGCYEIGDIDDDAGLALDDVDELGLDLGYDQDDCSWLCGIEATCHASQYWAGIDDCVDNCEWAFDCGEPEMPYVIPCVFGCGERFNDNATNWTCSDFAFCVQRCHHEAADWLDEQS